MDKNNKVKHIDSGVTPILDFLKDIAANNNREWFLEHRARYDEVRETFEDFAAQLIARIGAFDDSVRGLQVKDCTYRFYRDIRFSPDKSPYKRHLGCFVDSRGKKSIHGGYYFHLQPGECMLAAGSWGLRTKVIRQVRQSIVDGIEEFRGIVESPAFQQAFDFIGFDPLKREPHGLPRDFPYPQYLKFREYSCGCYLPDSFFEQSDWLDQVVERFRRAKPYMDFINYTVDDYC